MKMSKNISISDYSWEKILILLNQNYSINEILDILSIPKYEEIIDQIKYQLNLGNGIESIIKLIKGDIARYISFYINYLPLNQSIEVAIKCHHLQKKLKKRLTNIIIYPIALLIISIAIMFLFTYLVIPNIYSLFNDQQNPNLLITLLPWILKIITSLLLLIILLILVVINMKNHNLSKLWVLLNILKIDQFIKIYYSYYFANYLLQLHQSGLSTRQSLIVLSKEKNSGVSFIASKFNQLLNEGISFNQCLELKYLDDDFKKMAKLGYYSKTFYESLEQYLSFTELKLEKFLKRFSFSIQAIAYSCIGILVVIVYQAMLMPLNILNIY